MRLVRIKTALYLSARSSSFGLYTGRSAPNTRELPPGPRAPALERDLTPLFLVKIYVESISDVFHGLPLFLDLFETFSNFLLLMCIVAL